MNCDDYRKAIAAEPSFDDDTGHVDACADCQAWRADILALDAEIGRALALAVPEIRLPELPDVDTGRVSVLPARRRFPPTAWLALAATVVAAAVIGVRMQGSDVTGATLADQVLAHVDHESASLVVTDVPVSDQSLRDAVPASVSTLGHSAGLVTYVRSCEINGRPVPHLVVQGRKGPVTILLMPEEPVTEAITLSGEHVNGVILPVGNGSVAIIGERDESLENIQREVLNSVTWAT